MIKRILTVLLIVCFALCFVGCGGGTSAGMPGGGSVDGDNTGGGDKTQTEDSTGGGSGEQDEEITRVESVFSDFAAVDFDGNIVDSSVFFGYKVTMINVWATWCNPCKEEMPALAELNEEYESFQVIGIAYDTVDKNYNRNESSFNSALNIISQTGAFYRHLIPHKSFKGFLDGIKSVPVTIFVDEDGYRLGPVYSGKKSKQDWKKIIDDTIAFADENS